MTYSFIFQPPRTEAASAHKVYVDGCAQTGWLCLGCGSEYLHHGQQHVRTFARFVVHRILRHRKLVFRVIVHHQNIYYAPMQT